MGIKRNKAVKKANGFMKSNNPNSTKGSIYDPVGSQTTGTENILTQTQINVLYNDNSFCKRMIKDISKDALKAGFKVIKGETEDKDIMKRWKELELSDYVIDLMTYGMKDGICFLFPVLEGSNLVTGDELDGKSISKIKDFNLFYSDDINILSRRLDKMKPRYGYIESCHFKNTYGDIPSVKIDGSWLIEYEPNKRPDKFTKEGKTYGDSFYKGIWDLLVVKDNGIWSIGQMAYAMLLKVLKIGDQNALNKILTEVGKNKYQKMREIEFNSSTLAIIGKDDSIDGINFTQGMNIKDLKDYIYEELSMATGIPLSKLKGTSTGALASATEDSIRWYEYVEGFQTKDLDEAIRKIIKMLYAEKNDYKPDFRIEFNSIRTVEDKEAAEIKKLEAEELKLLGDTLVNLNNSIKDDEMAATLKSVRDRLKDKFILTAGE